jgi:hypothetical protein
MTLPLSEASMQRTIVEQAQWLGFRVHHVRDYRGVLQGDEGFPDLVLALNGYVFAWELKTAKGVVSDEQLAWERALTSPVDERGLAVLEYGVVRPAQLDDALAVLERVAQGRRS